MSLDAIFAKRFQPGRFSLGAKKLRLLFPSQPGVFFIAIIIVHGPQGVKLTFLPGEAISRQRTLNPVFRKYP